MKNFKIEEFDFHGAPGYPPVKANGMMDLEFLTILDKARELANTPFTITSGYRPAAYDGAVHGIPNSDHAQGKGADIAVPLTTNGILAHKIVKALFDAGMPRIGLNYKNNHIHVGMGDNLPSPCLFQE